jgi:AraC family transcriptional regulator of adaptative response / DNA-3-methyladenine glycosylase II
MSPKQYAQYHQLMFAKQLLHESFVSVSDIAFASGFNSVRRFNDTFKTLLKLTPSQVRKSEEHGSTNQSGSAGF